MFTVIHSSVLILRRKSKNDRAIPRKIAIYGPGQRFISVLHENGTASDRYKSKACFERRATAVVRLQQDTSTTWFQTSNLVQSNRTAVATQKKKRCSKLLYELS